MVAQRPNTEVDYGVRWMAPAVLGLVFTSPQANATPIELVPLNGPGHIRVSDSEGNDAIYYPVDPGSELQYAFTGPSKVVIWARSTRPPSQPWIYGPYLKMPVQADGWNITELVLRPRLTPMGTVDKKSGNFPMLADQMLVDIPGTCSTLIIKAPSGGPGLLIRAVEPEPNDPILDTLPVPATPPAGPSDSVASETQEDDAEMWEAEDQLAVSLFEEKPVVEEVEEEVVAVATKPEEEEEEEVVEEAAPPPPPPPPLTLQARISQSLNGILVGPRIGAGAPLQGNRMSPYIGVLSMVELLPVLTDAWKPEWGVVELQAGLGWYALKVEDELLWQDPYSGPVAIDVDYRTDVFPLQFDLRYRAPVQFGPVQPFATLGTGFSFTRRVEGKVTVGGLAGSSQASLGGAMQAGPGLGLAALAWSGGRKNFGQLNSDGENAKEGLGVLRLELAYLVSF